MSELSWLTRVRHWFNLSFLYSRKRVYGKNRIEKELFCQKLLITRETLKKTLSANLKPKKGKPQSQDQSLYVYQVCLQIIVMRQQNYLNMRGVIWRSWQETSFIFQRNFLLWLSQKWKLTSEMHEKREMFLFM